MRRQRISWIIWLQWSLDQGNHSRWLFSLFKFNSTINLQDITIFSIYLLDTNFAINFSTFIFEYCSNLWNFQLHVQTSCNKKQGNSVYLYPNFMVCFSLPMSEFICMQENFVRFLRTSMMQIILTIKILSFIHVLVC